MKLTDVEIRGKKVDAHVDAYGRFWIQDGDQRLSSGSETLDAAKAQAATRLRKAAVKVSVPFITREGERGEAYGIHASNGKVLAQLGDGRVQVDSYEVTFKGDTPDEVIDRYVELRDQLSALNRERQEIEQGEWTVRLSTVVRDAIEAAEEKGE